MNTSTQTAQNKSNLYSQLHGKLTIFAILGVLAIQASSMMLFELRYLCFLMPLLVFAGAAKQSIRQPSTMYFLFFLIGLSSIAVDGYALQKEIGESSNALEPSKLLVAALPRLMSSALLPLVLGVASYLALTAISGQQTTVDSNVLMKLTDWWATADAPSEIKNAVQQVIDVSIEMTNRFHQLEEQVESNSIRFAELANSTEQCCLSLREFKKLADEAHHDLQRFRSDLKTTNGEFDRIETSVQEMGQVLDQFAEIASHKILSYEP